MKVRTPKIWQSLPASQRKTIEEYCRGVALEAARESTERDARIMLDLYIKMVCLTMHDAFGYGEKRLMRFLAAHKTLFRQQVKQVKDGTQVEYLDRRMGEIFKTGGFPQKFFDGMLGPVETD